MRALETIADILVNGAVKLIDICGKYILAWTLDTDDFIKINKSMKD